MSNHIKVTGAPAISINLSQHSDKFRADSQTFLLNKSVNFVYGKNGTGKTTIVDEVSKQFSSSYDVCIFKDFEGVVENERLNAVSLGTTNATVQKQIDIIDAEISEINKQIRPPEGEDTKNLFMIAAEQKNSYEVQERKINSFYTNSAREIKNLSNPQIAKTSYDKVSFREDIANALLLSEDGIKKYRSIIRTVHKSHPRVITFPSMDLSVYLKSVNDIISSNLTQPCDIPELTNNAEKHNFARQGYNIHEHKLGETCAFCGNGISEERWNLLAMYFNDEIKSIEKQIDSMYKQIENEIIKARNITQIEEADFYDNFKADVDQLNVLILTKQSEYIKSLSDLQNGLIKKKENLFIRFSELEIEMPESYEKIRLEYGNLIEKNNNFAQNLVNEQNQARDALRYHQVKSMLDAWSFDDESNNLEVLRQLNEQAQLNLSEKRKEQQIKLEKRSDLIQQTRDEEIIAGKINKLLSTMGNISFSLKLVKDDVENQKGQYQIQGHDMRIRPVINLSRGEKNIVAFLYFLFCLDSNDYSQKPRIILLDDPMTSNDDTMQYLMISQIQKLYRTLRSGDVFVLFTHNCHFYLNVRPNPNMKYSVNSKDVSFYKKYGVYHLFSDGKRSSIKAIDKGKWDFRTNYETLWRELVFLYNANETTSVLMLNPCRKICETYYNFTKKDSGVFYNNNLSAKKLFDVNQHSIDDFEAEANGKTKEEIKIILQSLFIENGAEEHFLAHWVENENE